MDQVIYILDTTVIADRIRSQHRVLDRLTRASDAGHVLGLCDPVRYEVLRGLPQCQCDTEIALFP